MSLRAYHARMCNRYTPPSQRAIERTWQIDNRQPPAGWDAALYPRGRGPFIRRGASEGGEGHQLVVGQWGLVPSFSKTARLTYATNNARSEEVHLKASYKQPWLHGQRCIIPAADFDEPCWETGRNVWWRFRRNDGQPWGLAGLWNTWIDKDSGEILETYTLLTVNADDHPIMRRMHKPDPKLPVDQQDKRSLIAIEPGDVDLWLGGSLREVTPLLRPPAARTLAAGPAEEITTRSLFL